MSDCSAAICAVTAPLPLMTRASASASPAPRRCPGSRTRRRRVSSASPARPADRAGADDRSACRRGARWSRSRSAGACRASAAGSLRARCISTSVSSSRRSSTRRKRRRAFRFGQRLDANTLGREMIERHIDPVHLQIVVLAILQVIDDLQRVAQGVGVMLARRILAMHVEQIAPDRRSGIAAIVHQVGPVVVAQLGRIGSGMRSAGRCNRPRARGSPSGFRASRPRPARRAAPDP